MSKRRQKVSPRSKPGRGKARRSNSSGLIIFGVGLILFGLAAFLLWPRQQTSAGELAPSRRSLTVPVAVEYDAPELTLSDVTGKEHSLQDYRGQVILVNLWATWCPPCKAEMPTLEAYYQKHGQEGFMTLAISDGDPADAVSAFVQEYGLTFPVLLDPTYIASTREFKTQSLPSSFVIDRQGTIRLRWVGEIDSETLEEYVTPLIAE